MKNTKRARRQARRRRERAKRGRRLFEFYNEVGEKYPASRISYSEPASKRREKFIIELLKKSGGLTLDVGCAEGRYKPYIEDYVGFDISLPKLEKLKGRKAWAIAEYFPFKNGIFDRVIMLELLEHTWYRKQILGECYRVLRKNGILIMSTPYGVDAFLIQRNWASLEEHGVKFNPYVHGHFSEKYTRELLSSANFKIKLLHKITHKEKNRFLVTMSVKNG